MLSLSLSLSLAVFTEAGVSLWFEHCRYSERLRLNRAARVWGTDGSRSGEGRSHSFTLVGSG